MAAKAMPSCHYRISTHAMGLVHARGGNVHAYDDTVITHVWQCTRVLWRGGNCLLRQASRAHIA
jgi:hypothetical protein